MTRLPRPTPFTKTLTNMEVYEYLRDEIDRVKRQIGSTNWMLCVLMITQGLETISSFFK